MHASVLECKNEWTKLRNRFVKEKNKQKSNSRAWQSAWPYYDKMLFYSKYLKRKQTYTRTTSDGETSRPTTSSSVGSNAGIFSPKDGTEDNYCASYVPRTPLNYIRTIIHLV